jgi:hypothetical protein
MRKRKIKYIDVKEEHGKEGVKGLIRLTRKEKQENFKNKQKTIINDLEELGVFD